MTRLKMSSLKPEVRRYAKESIERDQLTFDGFHHFKPDFPVIFEVQHTKHVRKKMTMARMLTRFGQSSVAKRYYRLLRDNAHFREQNYELALVFSVPDLPSAVDAASKRRDPNHIKAAVLHSIDFDDEDTPGARFIWRADSSALPPHVKLDPPILVVESFCSFFRRVIGRYDVA